MKRKKAIEQYGDIDDLKFVHGQKMKKMELMSCQVFYDFPPAPLTPVHAISMTGEMPMRVGSL